MTLTMYDSIVPSTIPSNPQAVGGYVAGFWPDFSILVKDFPHAKHLSIAVQADEDAECLDIENGDAVPADAPAWFNRQRARGVKRPCFYANASTMPSVLAALGSAGIARKDYRVWTAHYTDLPHIEPGSDATQWTEHGFGRNLDISSCVDSFFDAPVKATNTVHYDRFDTEPRLGLQHSERDLVVKYDRLRKHGILNALRLHPIRDELAQLAARIYTVAHNQPGPGGTPSWGRSHRGWRYQQVVHRSQGQRFV